MNLEDTINKIRGQVSHERERFLIEEDVKSGIVEPLLTALGWPVNNTQIVKKEHIVGGKKVDYALRHSALVPAVFIEAKKIGGADKDAENQLAEYVSLSPQDVPIAVLTDGVEWGFYLTTRKGDFKNLKVKQISLISGSPEEHAEILRRYLDRQGVRSRESLKHAEEDYGQLALLREAKSHLPEAWRKLLSTPHSDFVKLLCEGTEEIFGVKADREDAAEFIRNIRPEANSAPMPNTVSAAASHIAPAPVPQQRITTANGGGAHRARRTTIRQIEFFGEKKNFSNNRTALAWLLVVLNQRDPNFMERFSNATNRIITRNPSEWVTTGNPAQYMNEHVYDMGGGWHMYKTANSQAYQYRVQKACEIAGVVYGSDVIMEVS